LSTKERRISSKSKKSGEDGENMEGGFRNIDRENFKVNA